MKNREEDQVISYLTLRKTIGIFGLTLPIILFLGTLWISDCNGVQTTISHYYYTVMGDVFSGVLCGVALFMYAYRGYDNEDNFVANIICVAALGIAFFPTTDTDVPDTCFIIKFFAPSFVGKIHYFSAAIFFFALAYFSLILFRKDGGCKTPEKIHRNQVYLICGFIILICMLLITLYINVPNINWTFRHLKPIFWLESITLASFGVSWLIKGGAFMEDNLPQEQC